MVAREHPQPRGRHGGDVAEMRTRSAVGRELGLRVHVDGARLWNAAVTWERPSRAGARRGHGDGHAVEGAVLSGGLARRGLGRVVAARAPPAQADRRRDAPGGRARGGRPRRARGVIAAAGRGPCERAAVDRGDGRSAAAERAARADEHRGGASWGRATRPRSPRPCTQGRARDRDGPDDAAARHASRRVAGGLRAAAAMLQEVFA